MFISTNCVWGIWPVLSLVPTTILETDTTVSILLDEKAEAKKTSKICQRVHFEYRCFSNLNLFGFEAQGLSTKSPAYPI